MKALQLLSLIACILLTACLETTQPFLEEGEAEKAQGIEGTWVNINDNSNKIIVESPMIAGASLNNRYEIEYAPGVNNEGVELPSTLYSAIAKKVLITRVTGRNTWFVQLHQKETESMHPFTSWFVIYENDNLVLIYPEFVGEAKDKLLSAAEKLAINVTDGNGIWYFDGKRESMKEMLTHISHTMTIARRDVYMKRT